jgi:hypothetical protein
MNYQILILIILIMLFGCSKDKGPSDRNHKNGIGTTKIKVNDSSTNSESTKSYNYWSKDTDRLTVTSEKGILRQKRKSLHY